MPVLFHLSSHKTKDYSGYSPSYLSNFLFNTQILDHSPCKKFFVATEHCTGMCCWLAFESVCASSTTWRMWKGLILYTTVWIEIFRVFFFHHSVNLLFMSSNNNKRKKSVYYYKALVMHMVREMVGPTVRDYKRESHYIIFTLR